MRLNKTLLAFVCVLALIHSTFADTANVRLLAEVPFKSSFRGIAFVSARINSSAPLDLLVDTGGASTLIDDHVAKELGLTTHSAQASVSGNSGMQVGFVPSGLVRIGPLEFKGRVVVAPLAPMDATFGRPLKGILGGDLFRAFVAQFDYEKQVIRFYGPDGYSCHSCGQELPVTLAEGVPYVELELSMPNAKSIRGRFLIDTGAGNAAVQVYKEVADREGLLSGVASISDEGRGIGGSTHELTVRASSLKIGNLLIARPNVAVTEDPPPPTAKRISVGLIGIEVLRRFTLTVDYPRSRIYLRPNQYLREPFVYDASGVRLRSDPPSFSSIRVAKVLSGSPAEAAGILPDDLVVAVDETATSKMTLDEVRSSLRLPGRTHRLRLRRGKRNVEAVLKTRDMLR